MLLSRIWAWISAELSNQDKLDDRILRSGAISGFYLRAANDPDAVAFRHLHEQTSPKDQQHNSES